MSDRPLVLICDEHASFYRDALADECPELRFATLTPAQEDDALIEQCEVVIAFPTGLPARMFARAKKLRWYQALSAGVDRVMRDPDRPADIWLTSASGIHGPFLGEMAAWSMLSLLRQARQLHDNQNAAIWHRIEGELLKGKTALVVGTGASGTEIRRICSAFGMRVLAASSAPRELPYSERCVGLQEIPAVLPSVDFLVLATPLNEQTRNLIDAATFARMKPESFLVNLSRGGIVDEDALLVALDQDKLAAAALDVFSQEPLPADHPLWRHPKVTVTPHVAGYVKEYARETLPLLRHNLQAYCDGASERMRNIVAEPKQSA